MATAYAILSALWAYGLWSSLKRKRGQSVEEYLSMLDNTL